MDNYTSLTYSITTNNDKKTTKIEYNSAITDNSGKQILTYYNNTINNKEQREAFSKILKDNKNTYEKLGCSTNKSDWNIQEYYNNKINKEYYDNYSKHNFDEYLISNKTLLDTNNIINHNNYKMLTN